MLKKIFITFLILSIIGGGVVYYLLKKNTLQNYLLEKTNSWLENKYGLTFTYDNLKITKEYYNLKNVKLYFKNQDSPKELLAFRNVFVTNLIINKKVDFDIVITDSDFTLKKLQQSYDHLKLIRNHLKTNNITLSKNQDQNSKTTTTNINLDKNKQKINLTAIGNDLVNNVRVYFKNCTITTPEHKIHFALTYNQDIRGNLSLANGDYALNFILKPNDKYLLTQFFFNKNEIYLVSKYKTKIQQKSSRNQINDLHFVFSPQKSYLKINNKHYKKIKYSITRQNNRKNKSSSWLTLNSKEITYAINLFNRENILIKGKTSLKNKEDLQKTFLNDTKAKVKINNLNYKNYFFSDLFINLENNNLKVLSKKTIYQKPININPNLQLNKKLKINYDLAYDLGKSKAITGKINIPLLTIGKKTYQRQANTRNTSKATTSQNIKPSENSSKKPSLKTLFFIKKNLSRFKIDVDIPQINYLDDFLVKGNKINLNLKGYKIDLNWESPYLKLTDSKWHLNNNSSAAIINLLTQNIKIKQSIFHLEKYPIFVESDYNKEEKIISLSYYNNKFPFQTITKSFIPTIKGRGDFKFNGSLEYSLKEKKYLNKPNLLFTNLSKSILVQDTALQKKIWSLPLISENKARNEDIFSTVSGEIFWQPEKEQKSKSQFLIKDVKLIGDNYLVNLKKGFWQDKQNHNIDTALLFNNYFKEEYVTVPIDALAKLRSQLSGKKVATTSGNPDYPNFLNFVIANNKIKIKY